METTHIFAQRIKELREDRGLSQGKLADELGISRGALSYYESYQRTADISMLVKFASYFGVTTDYLLGLSDVATTDADLKMICDATGLSEKTVKRIEKYKNDFFYCKGLDILAFEMHLITEIAQYTFGFAMDDIGSSDFSQIPLTFDMPLVYSKIAFAEIIEHLPRLRERMEKQTINNPEKMRELFLEFLLIYGDAEKLRVEEGLYTKEEMDDGTYDLDCLDFSEHHMPTNEEADQMMEMEFKHRQAQWDFLEYVKKARTN